MATETKEPIQPAKTGGTVTYKFKGGKESLIVPGLGNYTNEHLKNPKVISVLKKRNLFETLVEVA